MTLEEARKVYQDADCSYFKMCNHSLDDYAEYKKLRIDHSQEIIWKKGKIQQLLRKIYKTHDYKAFISLCFVADEFRSHEQFMQIVNMLEYVELPTDPLERLDMVEVLIGPKIIQARSGLVFYAYDIGQRAIAILLLELALECLDMPEVEDTTIRDMIRIKRRTCRKIIIELDFHYHDIEMKNLLYF